MASLKIKEIFCILHSLLLFISGVLLIGFSVVICYKIFYHFNFIPGSSLGPFITFFLFGFIHLLLTWLGIKGPTREHNFHLFLFMGITILLFICECGVGVWSVMLWDDVDFQSGQIMSESFDQLLKSNYDKNDWARLESKLKCCGLNNPDEYKRIQTIPLSCCNLENQNTTCPEVYTTGCKQPLINYVKRILIDGIVMGFSSCILQAVGLFAFVTFFRALKEERSLRIQRVLEAQRRASSPEGGSANPTPSSPPPITPHA